MKIINGRHPTGTRRQALIFFAGLLCSASCGTDILMQTPPHQSGPELEEVEITDPFDLEAPVETVPTSHEPILEVVAEETPFDQETETEVEALPEETSSNQETETEVEVQVEGVEVEGAKEPVPEEDPPAEEVIVTDTPPADNSETTPEEEEEEEEEDNEENLNTVIEEVTPPEVPANVPAEEQEPEEEEPVVPGTIIGGELEVSSQGDGVTIECLGKNAGYRHELYLDNTDTFICNSADRGTIVNLGQFPAGTELIFRLDVKNTGKSYYTGGAERNPDQEIHARVETFEDGSQEFGFEDLYGGGDRDYDDCMFSLTGTRSQSEENAQE